MIVPAMTAEEIRKEMLDDMRSVPSSKMDAFRKNFRSLVLRSSKFPINKSYEYRTDRKNLLTITLNAQKRGKHSDPNICVYCVYERREGKYAAVWSLSNRVTIFPPHFFDRYQKRILKDDSLSRNEVIRRCITNNGGHLSLEINDDVESVFKCFEGHYSDEIINIVSATLDGYCFGEIHGKTVIMKTIISENMLSDRQKKLFPALQELFIQANKELHGASWTGTF